MSVYTNILEDVKKSLGLQGNNFHDDTIQEIIDEVKEFLIDGGVAEKIVNSEKAKGTIARGVADLWNYGSGGTSLSPYFWQRASQLSLKESGEDD